MQSRSSARGGTQQRTEMLGKPRELGRIRIDDQAAAAGGAARARLGDVRDERVVVRDLLADRNVTQRDPPRAAGVRLAIPLRQDLRVRIARVIEPARLIDEVPEEVLAETRVLAGEAQRVRVVEVGVL